MYLRERPTPEQWQAVAWMFIVVLAVMGMTGVWYGFSVPPDKLDIGNQLKGLGVVCLVLAIGAWGIKRGVEALLA